MTTDEIIEALAYKSGWKCRDVPGVTLTPQSLFYWDVIDEINRLRAEITTLRNFMTGIHTTAHLALYSAHPKGTDHDHG